MPRYIFFFLAFLIFYSSAFSQSNKKIIHNDTIYINSDKVNFIRIDGKLFEIIRTCKFISVKPDSAIDKYGGVLIGYYKFDSAYIIPFDEIRRTVLNFN